MYGFLLVFYSNFEIFDFKNSVTLKTVLGSVKVMELLPFDNIIIQYLYSAIMSYADTEALDREHMTSYERSITTMGLSYRFRDRRRFRSKIAKKNSHPLYFAPPLKRVPIGIGYWRMGSKNRMMGLPSRERSLTISSAVWIQCTNVTDGRTDGQTDRHRATATALTHSVSR